MRNRRSVILALAGVMAMCAAAGAQTVVHERGWQPIYRGMANAPRAGVQLFRTNPGPVEFTGWTFSSPDLQVPFRLASIGISNPRWERIEAITLYWRLFDDADLTVPVSAGVTSQTVFPRPLRLRDGADIKLDLNPTTPLEDRVYRLEVGIDCIIYQDGVVWRRPK